MHRWTLRATLLHHPLPYKHHLMMTLVQLGIYLAYALPHQLAALEIYQLQPWVHRACKPIDGTVLAMLPTVDLGFGQLCEQQQVAGRMVLVFCYVAIALLFSVNFIYWEVGWLAGPGLAAAGCTVGWAWLRWHAWLLLAEPGCWLGLHPSMPAPCLPACASAANGVICAKHTPQHGPRTSHIA